MEDWLGLAVKQFTLTSTPRKGQAALLDLPPDVPETAHITLSDGSTKGQFIIRTKTVVDEHFTEHTLTSFLKKSGVKGGWKTAIWISTAGGGMALQTWLSQRKLTLAMLGELAKNAKAAGWQRPLLPGEVEFRRGKAHGQEPEGSQASRPTASRRSSLSARPLNGNTEAAPKTASLRHLALGKTSDAELQTPMWGKTAAGSLAWQGGAALRGLAAANAKGEGHAESQHAATPGQHLAMQAPSLPPQNTGPPEHHVLGVPHITAPLHGSMHSMSPPADIQALTACGHALEAQAPLPVSAAAQDHGSLPLAKSLDHDAESQGFIAAHCASPATDTAYAHDMSAVLAGTEPAGWLSFLQSEAPVNEPVMGSAITSGDPQPPPQGMGLMAGAALQPRPAPQPQRQAASLLTLPSVRKLITSGGGIAGAQRGLLPAQPSSNLTIASCAMQPPPAAATTGHTLRSAPVSQHAVAVPRADSAIHSAPSAEACQPSTLHAAGDQQGGPQCASLKACLLGMLVADLHRMGQERPSAPPVLPEGGAADGAHGEAQKVPEDLRQREGASLLPSTTADAGAGTPHMQAVEGTKVLNPASDALGCQRELAVVAGADKQDGASPSSNNTTIMPSTLAANMSRCLALKRKQPDAPDEAAMRQELTKRFKGLLKAKTASEALLLQMEGRVTKLEAEKEAVIAQAQKDKASMESALQQGQDGLCQLAASKDALQRAHTKLAAAYTALQDQHKRVREDHETALQNSNLYNEVKTAFTDLARTSGAQIAELRAACTNDHEQKQSLQRHYAACMGSGIEALRKELRLEVMREIMEDTESLDQAAKESVLTTQPVALQTA